ncbi:hypothetical protein F5Y14DRAFT_395172 [Nemania sp. NC0429]|nr:hypothetical protein F5Y14DRAFT_395172 [Nemania sp. NC0429]
MESMGKSRFRLLPLSLCLSASLLPLFLFQRVSREESSGMNNCVRRKKAAHLDHEQRHAFVALSLALHLAMSDVTITYCGHLVGYWWRW